MTFLDKMFERWYVSVPSRPSASALRRQPLSTGAAVLFLVDLSFAVL